MTDIIGGPHGGKGDDCGPRLDGIVEGGNAADLIDLAFAGDPDGDRIDANDAVLAGQTKNDDIVKAFDGDDTVLAGDGNDTVFGGEGDDSILGEKGNDTLYGDAGDDAIAGGFEDDDAFGGSGNDSISGDDGQDFIFGGTGDDEISGGAGDDAVKGDAGADTLSGGDGADWIDGGADRDVIVGGVGDVVVSGGSEGDDLDVLDLRGLPPYRIEILNPDSNGNGFDGTVVFLDALGEPTGESFGFTEIEDFLEDPHGPALDGTVEGSAGDDVIDAAYLGDPEGDRVDANDAILPGQTGNDDLIYAFGGDDTVTAGDGDDLIFGGAGNDLVYGGLGDDTVFGNTGDDTSFGGAGNDSFQDSLGSDTVFGGSGDDIVRLSEGGTANMDSVLGGTGNDLIYGGKGDDCIDSSNGGVGLFDNPYPPLPVDPRPDDDDDTVYGSDGNDSIRTGDDSDLIYGGKDDDRVDAGIDDDTLSGDTGNDTLIGGEGNDSISGGSGNDVIYGGLGPLFPDGLNIPDDAGDLVTDNGRDQIDAGSGDDTVFGLDDDDSILGGTGNDSLDGGVDDDTVGGGAGNDVITGGQGNDLLSGDNDRDVFLGGNGGDSVDGGAGGDDFDTLDLTGSGVDFVTYTSADREDGIVTFLDGSTLTFEEIENVIPCFTPGTMIATPRGERPVEDLREGDRIITRDNGIQEIRWVGRKEVSGRALVGAPHLRPVLVKAGALGHGLPERDMLVSPNHRILVSNDRTQLYFEENEVLAAAKHMVGNPGVHTVDTLSVTYLHFMFDRHEVVLSNGAWTESFQPGDWSLNGIGNAQRNELLELFPELKTREGIDGFGAARKSLKRHEAKLLVR